MSFFVVFGALMWGLLGFCVGFFFGCSGFVLLLCVLSSFLLYVGLFVACVGALPVLAGNV